MDEEIDMENYSNPKKSFFHKRIRPDTGENRTYGGCKIVEHLRKKKPSGKDRIGKKH